MSRWTEQFENNAIHETLKWMKDSVSTEFTDVDTDDVSEKRRFLKYVSGVEDMLQSLDPELLSFNRLDVLNTALRHQSVTASLAAFTETGDVSNLVTLNDYLTNHLHQIFGLPSLFESSPNIESLKGLEELVDSTYDTLVDKKDELTQDFDKLTASAEERAQALTELSTQIEQKKSEIDTHITEWQSQFSTAQDSRSQEFSKWRDEFNSEKNTEIQAAIDKYKNDLDQYKTDFVQEISDLLSDGKDKHQNILELYQLTAGDSVGAGYLQNAEAEKKQADNWRLISVGFIISTIFWLLFAYNSNFHQTHVLPEAVSQAKPLLEKTQTTNSEENKNAAFSWIKLFMTFSISGVLLWGSAYAAQQSTKHRKNEKRTRWFALEVKAIDPFISSLTPEQQNELKKQLSEKMFGQFSSDDDAKVIDEHILKVVADTIGGVLSKIPKS